MNTHRNTRTHTNTTIQLLIYLTHWFLLPSWSITISILCLCYMIWLLQENSRHVPFRAMPSITAVSSPVPLTEKNDCTLSLRQRTSILLGKGLRRDGGRRDVDTCTFTQGNMTRQSSDLFCSWLPPVWNQFLAFFPLAIENVKIAVLICNYVSCWLRASG